MYGILPHRAYGTVHAPITVSSAQAAFEHRVQVGPRDAVRNAACIL